VIGSKIIARVPEFIQGEFRNDCVQDLEKNIIVYRNYYDPTDGIDKYGIYWRGNTVSVIWATKEFCKINKSYIVNVNGEQISQEVFGRLYADCVQISEELYPYVIGGIAAVCERDLRSEFFDVGGILVVNLIR